MMEKNMSYRAIFSSDWNECLAPTGPFDMISFHYPGLSPDLKTIFEQYTGNIISLREATGKIRKILPGPITEDQMDAYLDQSFITYKGVPDLIEWCKGQGILFMINTTGMAGFFQRVFAKGLLPPVPVIFAHPMILYTERNNDTFHLIPLLEIRDKWKNTEKIVQSFKIPPNKIILVGDSGGDGPHFQWGAERGAFLIGSMSKPSLKGYCQKRNIAIDLFFGLSYLEGEKRDPAREMETDFMELTWTIGEILKR